MSYRYLALVNPDDSRNSGVPADFEAMAHRAGMQERFVEGSITLFATSTTPTLRIPCGAILIGTLFSREGTRFVTGEGLPKFSSHSQLRRYILDFCWGEYLLIQPSADGTQYVSIMRDPSGGVPCIYVIRASSGFVTSDIALASSLGLYAKRIDWDCVGHYLLYPHLKTGRTGLADVMELLPGCSLDFRGSRMTIKQEWSPWDFVAPAKRKTDANEASTAVRKSVSMVVKAWADTHESILLELSGGLDSSIVGVCLQDVRAHVSCCNVVTPTRGADERHYAGLIANVLGIELFSEELSFESAKFDFASPTYSVAPRIGPLQYAIDRTMESAADRQGADAYFSGGGGDTVFCYLTTAAPAADAFLERGWAAGFTAIRDLAELHQCTFWKAGRLTLRKLRRPPKAPYAADHLLLAPFENIGIPEGHPWFSAPADALPGDRERIFDLVGNQVFVDATPRREKRWLRMPLLSQPVVEACLSVPSWMWISGGRNRAVARAAFADLLPPSVLNRRSKGTFMSYLGALYRRNRLQMRDFLLAGHLQAHGLLDTDALQRFVEGELPPRNQSFTRVFDLCRVENWIRQQS